ncbi:MAG: hypothetical protein IJW30_06895 [Clostridia bacterium]|nr:hypothetical protein [Clostridia bacterium]MBQ9774377.1 hypothetical protein [Clostridia bacterium]
MENEVVVKKGNCFWKVVGIVLAVLGVCLVAVKIWQKIRRKKKAAVEACEDAPAVEGADEAVAEETFEVPAEAVIANAEDMAEEAN